MSRQSGPSRLCTRVPTHAFPCKTGFPPGLEVLCTTWDCMGLYGSQWAAILRAWDRGANRRPWRTRHMTVRRRVWSNGRRAGDVSRRPWPAHRLWLRQSVSSWRARRPGSTSAGIVAILIAVGLDRDGVGAAQPAREIDVGAAARAERPIVALGGAAADRALAASPAGVGLRHAHRLLPRVHQGDRSRFSYSGRPRPAAAS